MADLATFLADLKVADDDGIVTVEMGGVTYDLEAEELRAAVLDVTVPPNLVALPRLCTWCGPLVAGSARSASEISSALSALRRV